MLEKDEKVRQKLVTSQCKQILKKKAMRSFYRLPVRLLSMKYEKLEKNIEWAQFGKHVMLFSHCVRSLT